MVISTRTRFAALALAATACAALSLSACANLGLPGPSAPPTAHVAHDKQGELVEVAFQTLDSVVHGFHVAGRLHGDTATKVDRIYGVAHTALLAYRAASSTADRAAQIRALVDAGQQAIAQLKAIPGLSPELAGQLAGLATVIDALETSLTGGVV